MALREEKHTSCVTLYGIPLPGFSGGGANFSSSYVAPLTGGLLFSIGVLAYFCLRRRKSGRA
jgi:hypothetical protein